MTDDSTGALAAPRVKAVRPLRVVTRLCALLAWTVICYLAVCASLPVRVFSRPLVRKLHRWFAVRWACGVGAITGMRVQVHGRPPQKPCFLVSNHVVWTDGFAMIRFFDCTYVSMAEIQTMPIVRTIIRGLEPIFVYRKREDTHRVVGLMVETLKSGGSIFMCQEAIVSPGREIRRFRGALLEAAVITGMPVYCATITYRTPDDCPPPSQCILFGPDPYFRTPDGEIPESELAVWGSERSMKRYLMRFLSVSSYTVVITFGEHPINGTDKFELADALRDAVRARFTPVK